MQWLGKTVGAAVLVSLAAAGCTATATAIARGGAAAHSGFAGYKWQVSAVTHGGKLTPVPARDDVYLEFGLGGRFGASDPVNFHSGAYRQVGDGFSTGELGVTLVLYAGGNPVKLLAMSAISALDGGVHARTAVSGKRMTVSVAGYLLSCQRDGPPVNF